MPKASCPMCHRAVKYSKKAAKGSTITCPECAEVFIPPSLVRKAGYDPEADEDAYAAGTADTADELDKRRHAETAMREGEELADQFQEPEPPKRGLLDDPKTGLLLFGFAATGGLPFSIYLTQWWGKLEEMKVVLILIVLVAGILAAVGLSCSFIAWKRKASVSAGEKQDKR